MSVRLPVERGARWCDRDRPRPLGTCFFTFFYILEPLRAPCGANWNVGARGAEPEDTARTALATLARVARRQRHRPLRSDAPRFCLENHFD